TLQAGKGWIVAGAALLGFLLAFLLLIPGRLASAWRSWTAGRQAQALEERLLELRQAYARLQGSHRLLLDEHDRMMDQMLAPGTAAAGRERAPSSLGDERDDYAATPTKPAAIVAAPRPTGPLYPPPPAVPPWQRVASGSPPAPRAQPTQPGPTLVERLR